MPSTCFVPHRECRVASGDCFTAGRCLDKCVPKMPVRDARVELAIALRLLGVLVDFTAASRGITKYVDGSSLDQNMHEARALIARHR